MYIKGLEEVARESENLNRCSVLPIYYDMADGRVNTEGVGDYVTDLIRPNTEEEIEMAVKRWLWM